MLCPGPGAIGGLDVQAIMDRAIELRRKAIEESESEEEGEAEEGEWSDEGWNHRLDQRWRRILSNWIQDSDDLAKGG